MVEQGFLLFILLGDSLGIEDGPLLGSELGLTVGVIEGRADGLVLGA